MYTFGTRSLTQLESCHPDLQKIFKLAIKRSKVDFGISEGHRTKSRQKELFDKGLSKIDGELIEGKHNKWPSEAVDIYAYHKDYNTRRKLAYDKVHLTYIAGVIDSCAKELYEKGEVQHLIRWGANWDSDGVIDYDQNFDDFPHHEIIKPKN